MRVLHVLNHSLPHVDGYSQRSQNILHHQQQHGLHVVAVTSPKHENPAGKVETIQGIPFYRTIYPPSTRGLTSMRFVREWLLIRRLAKRILEVARLESIEIIHAHSPSLNGLAALSAARRLGLPLVYELRALWEDAAADRGRFGPRSLKYVVSRRMETRLLKRAKAVTTICEGLRKEIIRRGIGPDKVYVCPNGVDTKWYSPRPPNQDLKKSLGVEGKFLLGFIGSFYHWEGLDLLLQALESMARQHPEVHALLIGSGQREVQLRQLARTLQIGNHVTFTGRVPPERVLDYYSIVDLCVYPRKKMRLTDLVTPLKPLEAMAMEKLILASDVGGHLEIVKDRVNGFVFRAENKSDFAEKIIDIALHSTKLDQVRRSARTSVLESRNWSRIVGRYVNLYQKLL